MIVGFLAMALTWLGLIFSLGVVSSQWPQYEEIGGLIVLILLAPFIAIPIVFLFLGWRLGRKLDLREE